MQEKPPLYPANCLSPIGYHVIGDETIADAILDRLIHTAHRVELKGESMRRKKL